MNNNAFSNDTFRPFILCEINYFYTSISFFNLTTQAKTQSPANNVENVDLSFLIFVVTVHTNSTVIFCRHICLIIHNATPSVALN